jgi:hypothetical protein
MNMNFLKLQQMRLSCSKDFVSLGLVILLDSQCLVIFWNGYKSLDVYNSTPTRVLMSSRDHCKYKLECGDTGALLMAGVTVKWSSLTGRELEGFSKSRAGFLSYLPPDNDSGGVAP